VVGIHNPASTKRQGDQSRARALAQQIELSQITAYREADPKTPVLLMGDFNAREQAFCYLTGTGVLQAAAGGSVGSGCSMPSYGGVDWIFGSTDLDFAGHVVDRGTKGSISDHPLVVADATIPASQR
jgi:endonuclease/exonuclease/phosphatase family metal-dependent hydrolase